MDLIRIKTLQFFFIFFNRNPQDQEETIMADEEFIGIRKEKIRDLVSALLCAAVGTLFVNIGLKKYYILSYDPIYQVTHILFFDPLVLASIGFGFVFLVSAVFFIRNAFIGDFFVPGTPEWPIGSKFCIFLVLLWIFVHLITRFL